ncbi:MAG: hypothetical protein JSS83_05895 [Cyanobacteria bacterium SZAS LIN-3]|nr:hypothetical protein [Cyanobacteria bacterium SZAS LIN-3]
MLVLLSIYAVILFTLLYQYGAPRMSDGGVAFPNTGLAAKLGTGAMLFVSSTILIIPTVALVAGLLFWLPAPATNPFVRQPASAPVLLAELVVGLLIMQLAHWATTAAMGKWLPHLLRVDTGKSAFQAALLPTVNCILLYPALAVVFFR